MATYRAEPGTEVNGCDQAGNVWPKPRVFDDKGLIEVAEDEQDVYVAFENAVANGAFKRAKG